MPNRTVDVEVSKVVLDAAYARLELVREDEKARTGTSSTTMATVARQALLSWKPPKNPGPRKHRRATFDQVRTWARAQGLDPGEGSPSPELRYAYREAHGLLTHPVRFTFPQERYAELRAEIHGRHYTVSRVIEAALERFARTGKF